MPSWAMLYLFAERLIVMSKIIVSGLINIETVLKIDSFPLNYFPVRYAFNQVSMTTSGVGYNVAKALTILGDDVRFLSIIGRDESGDIIRQSLMRDGICPDNVLGIIPQTPQSVIIYENSGARQIHVDLKNIQETAYPADKFRMHIADADCACICNINFSRPFLFDAKKSGCLIATDVHALSDINDDYNRDFMANSNILFISNEKLPCHHYDFAREVINKYGNDIVVIGLGAAGALIALKKDNSIVEFPAVKVREIRNTVGAGDSLFSAFVHSYMKTKNPYESLKQAMTFAAYKIGAENGAAGFLTEPELEKLLAQN